MFSISAPCREVLRKTWNVILKFGPNADVIGDEGRLMLTVAGGGRGKKMAKNLLT